MVMSTRVKLFFIFLQAKSTRLQRQPGPGIEPTTLHRVAAERLQVGRRVNPLWLPADPEAEGPGTLHQHPQVSQNLAERLNLT